MGKVYKAVLSDFTTRSFPCTEENEDLCKFTCLRECNKASNCWTGYGYREEGNKWTCKWISSKSWTFNSGPTRESSGAVRNLSMFRKMRIGKNFAGTIEKRMSDMSYSQMCHAKKNSKSLSTHSYFIPIPCRDYESSCIFGFVVDSRTDRIQQVTYHQYSFEKYFLRTAQIDAIVPIPSRLSTTSRKAQRKSTRIFISETFEYSTTMEN